MDKLVTTIIPVFERTAMLQEAVHSVLAQTYRSIEIIIVDDGSMDSTPSAIAALVEQYPEIVRSVRRVNGGPGAARESGREVARGEFIQYLDSDDLLLPKKFEVQVRALLQCSECGIAYGMTHHSSIGEALEPVPIKRTGEQFEYLFPALLRSRWWSTSTPLFRREVTDKIGPWLPLRNEEDWEYEVRAARLGVRLVFCPEFVSVTRRHDQGRLGCGGTTDPVKLKDRAVAHALILEHAWAAGIDVSLPEMRHFARELFLLARQCGAAGLSDEAARLFSLARSASLPERANGWDFRLYRFASGLFGWDCVGKWAGHLDRWRGNLGLKPAVGD